MTQRSLEARSSSQGSRYDGASQGRVNGPSNTPVETARPLALRCHSPYGLSKSPDDSLRSHNKRRELAAARTFK